MNFKSALIVDDSKLARITLRKKLSSYGLAVALAESGKEAIDSLAANSPDIIFMDHLMPEMDGFEAAAKIRTMPEYAAIPIIMCTGKEHEGYLEEAQAIGANQILSKPPVDEALEKILSTSFDATASAADIPMATPAEALPVFDEADEIEEIDLGDLGIDLADDIAAIDESIADLGDFDVSSISLSDDDASSVVQSVEDMGDLSDLGTNVFVGGHISDSQPIVSEQAEVPAVSIDESQIAELVSEALAAETGKLRADISKQVDHLQMQLEAQANAEPVATEAPAINRDELLAASKEVLKEEKLGLVADVIAAMPAPALTGLSDKTSDVDMSQIQTMVNEQVSAQLQDVQKLFSEQMHALEAKLADIPPLEAQAGMSMDDVKLVVQAEINQLKAEGGVPSAGVGETVEGVSEERLQQFETLVAQQLAANKAATEGLINEALEEVSQGDGASASPSAPVSTDVQDSIDMLTEQQQLMHRQQQLPKSLSSIAMVLGLSALALSIFMFIR